MSSDAIHLRCTVQHLDGSGQETAYEVDTPRILFGSASHCDIQLPRTASAPEQLELVFDNTDIVVRTLTSEPSTKVLGQPFSGGRIADGTELQLSGLAIRVEKVELGARLGTSKRGTVRRGRLLFGVAFGCMVLVAAGYFYVMHAVTPQTAQRPDKPSLFTTSAVTCDAPNAALARGKQWFSKAYSLWERSPFYLRDGVTAVDYFLKSAACLEAGGDAHAAQRATTLARALRNELEGEYHLHWVRLERALDTQGFDIAAVEVQYLSDLLHHQRGEYLDWLESLKRRIALGSTKEKKRHL